jgi:hypothetical protein
MKRTRKIIVVTQNVDEKSHHCIWRELDDTNVTIITLTDY